MAGNDVDHVIHIIYEKFIENQKDRKYENRTYIAEEEFKQDLRDFVKKSSVEDKGLLIAEIYRNVSEDVLDISFDGKITVSPKVLKSVEKQIQERKERENKLNNLNVVQENIEDDLDNISISDLTREQYMSLSKEKKFEIFAESISGLTKDFGFKLSDDEIRAFYKVTSENVSTDKVELEKEMEECVSNVITRNGSENETENGTGNETIENGARETLIEAYKKKIELLSGDFGQIFIHEKKLDALFFAKITKFLQDNDNTGHFVYGIKFICETCGYDSERINSIIRAVKKFGPEKLKKQMSEYVAMESVISEFESMYTDIKDTPVDEYKRRIEELTELKAAIENGDVEKVFVAKRRFFSKDKVKNQEKIDNARRTREYIRGSKEEKEVIEHLAELGDVSAMNIVTQRNNLRKFSSKKRIRKPKIQGKDESEEKKFLGEKNKILRLKNRQQAQKDREEDSEEIIENVTAPTDVEEGLEDKMEMQIAGFELGSLSGMVEDMRVDAIDEPVTEHQDIPVEPTLEPVVVQNDNNAVHVETITIAEPDEKVIEQVVEQTEERKDESNVQNNLLKEVTWADRAKQGLFKFGKKLSAVVKAVTSRDSSKGLFERISEAINGSDSSSSDTTSSSSSSSTAGPSVDGKKVQTPVDYLNTQFNIDVRKAAESAKAAAETSKDDKKQITVNESSHEDEVI